MSIDGCALKRRGCTGLPSQNCAIGEGSHSSLSYSGLVISPGFAAPSASWGVHLISNCHDQQLHSKNRSGAFVKRRDHLGGGGVLGPIGVQCPVFHPLGLLDHSVKATADVVYWHFASN